MERPLPFHLTRPSYQGITDEDIIPLLLRLKKPTLLTRDEDFWDHHLAHARYSIVWFDVEVEETAFWIERFLGHPLFRTSAQRLGKIARVRPMGIEHWAKNTTQPTHIEWS